MDEHCWVRPGLLASRPPSDRPRHSGREGEEAFPAASPQEASQMQPCRSASVVCVPSVRVYAHCAVMWRLSNRGNNDQMSN